MATTSTVPEYFGKDIDMTISEAIGNDHKTLDAYADQLKSASTLQEQIEWRNQFTWALARHAISEEMTWYPAMEKHLGKEGIELADVDREQHMAVGPFNRPICLNPDM